MRLFLILATPFLMAAPCGNPAPPPPPEAGIIVTWTAAPACPRNSTVDVFLRDDTDGVNVDVFATRSCVTMTNSARPLRIDHVYTVTARLIAEDGSLIVEETAVTQPLVQSVGALGTSPANKVAIAFAVPEVCDRAGDEDGDGDADCDDADCDDDPVCTGGTPIASFPLASTGTTRPKLFRDPFKVGRYHMIGFADGHVATFDGGVGLPFAATGGVALSGVHVVDAKPAGSGSLRVVGRSNNTAYVAKLATPNDAGSTVTQFVYGPSPSEARAFVPSAGGNVVIGTVDDTTTKIAIALFSLAFDNLQIFSALSDGVNDWRVLGASAIGSDNAIVGVREGATTSAFAVRASAQGAIVWQTVLKPNTSVLTALFESAALPNGDVVAVGVEVLPGSIQAGLFVVFDGVTGLAKVKRRSTTALPLTAIAVTPAGRIFVGGALSNVPLVAELGPNGNVIAAFEGAHSAVQMSLALDGDGSLLTGVFGDVDAFVSREPATTCSYQPSTLTLVDSDAIGETSALTSIQMAASIGAVTTTTSAAADTLSTTCP